MAWDLGPLPSENDTEQRLKWFVSVDPSDEVVTWATIRAQLKLDNDTEQAYGEFLRDAAVDFAEDCMATALAARTITANFYDNEPIILPRTPMISIESVTDSEGTTYTEAADDFTVVHVGHQCRLVFDPVAAYPLTVVYRAGYPDVTKVKPSIKMAILQHVATLYENRQSVGDKEKLPVPHALEAFYRLNSHARLIG